MNMSQLITLSNFELTRFFFAVVSLLFTAHVFGYVFHRFRMPRVVGEIAGGVVLGPTVLGYFAPGVYSWIFNAFEGEGKLISLIYWIGLVLLMFLSGFEVQKSLNREDGKLCVFLLAGATLLPFCAGWIAPRFYDFSPYLGVHGNMLSLTIVIAVAVAVTSIPVISKIFIDLDIMNSRFAKVVLATATVQDVILWVALAVATGLVAGEAVSLASVITTVLITLTFFLVALFAMPRVIRVANHLRANLLIRSSVSGYVLFICFLFSAVASVLDVNIVFGAFLAGIVVGTIPDERFNTVKSNIKELSLAFFIPIYFAVVGLKLDLVHHFDPGLFFGFLAFSAFFETIGTVTAARLAGQNWLSSFNLGVAMNTRGGPGIVLATIAFDMGIINETFFVVLVLIAVTTSLMAGFWFRYILGRGWELMKSAPRVSSGS